MTQILINAKHGGVAAASSAYNNIERSAGLVALTDSTTAATNLTFEETLPPVSSISNGATTDLYGYEKLAVESVWYTGATIARNVIGGTLGVGETITSIKWYGGAPQATLRSTDITINGVTKTHDDNSTGAAPVEWVGADLTGITLPFDIDWVKSIDPTAFGYLGVIEITTSSGLNIVSISDGTIDLGEQSVLVTLSGSTGPVTAMTLNGITQVLGTQVDLGAGARTVEFNVTGDIPDGVRTLEVSE